MSPFSGVPLHISASALRILNECPKQFFFRYMAGVPPSHQPANLVLGKAIHRSLACFYMALKNGEPEPALAQLHGLASIHIAQAVADDVPVRFDEGEGPEELVDEAERLLRAFLVQGYRPARVLGVEEEFVLPVFDPTGELLPFEESLVGAMDLVALTERGEVLVVDHKVRSRSAPSTSSLEDLQMALYAMVARLAFAEGRSVRLAHRELLRLKSPRVQLVDVGRGEGDEREADEAVQAGLALISAAVDQPLLLGRRRSWRCRDCGYRRPCEAAHGRR
jgi:hypothetical protein